MFHAPEHYLKGSEYETEHLDLFAVGVVLFVMVT